MATPLMTILLAAATPGGAAPVGAPARQVAPLAEAEAALAPRLVALFAAHFDVAPETLALDMRIVEDMGGDSLDAVELVMAVEDDFGVYVADEDLESLQTIRDTLRYIIAHPAPPAPAASPA